MKTLTSGLLMLATLSAPAMAATTALPPAPAPVTWQPAQTLAPQAQPAPVAANGAPAATALPPPVPGTPLPLPSPAMDYAQGQVTPLTPEETGELHRSLDALQRNEGRPVVSAVPRISSLTVSLSPGASLPLLRVLPNFPGTVAFTDETGAPWNIAAPPVNGNGDGFAVHYIPDSPSMVVEARRPYDTGTVTVYLQGLPVPIVLSLSSGEPDNTGKSQLTDSRLDLRIPQRGPAARAQPQGREKVGLYNADLQAFLDGVPPQSARRITTAGDVPMTTVWQQGDDLYIRSRSELRDSFEQTLSSADGTHVWKLPVTPEVAFSVMGKTATLTLNLE
ncbi:conjugal transfer protein TraN [Enterobacter hormaechei]|nr:conjugal transfer protein TraN [Enterobacter hormaechei]